MKTTMLSRRALPALGAVFASVFATTPAAKAAVYTFTEITNNSPINVAGQLAVDVFDQNNMATFRFTNNVGLASSVTDVYFQALFAPPPTILSSAGVSFGTPATPGDLPGGNAVNFQTTLNLSADSNPPAAPNGIDAASEWLELSFGYGSYTNIANVISALNSGDLRIGLHVQALSDGDSEGFVNIPPPEIPPPEGPGVPDGGSTVALLGLALGLVALVRRQIC